MKQEIVGVRFKKAGRIYYFAPNGYKANKGDYVIVETIRGVECGICEIANRFEKLEKTFGDLKPVLRVADEDDMKKHSKNKEDAKDAFKICVEKINKHKLEMKLIDVEYTFDRSKILFYFTAEGRIDFRELVKDLAGVYKTRIELRQIGVRDEAKILNGLGICGRVLCCSTFLGDFNHVSIKMAKDQNLSLNPTKISGACGRLMCCIKYEEETYREISKKLPVIGDLISTPDGKGEVTAVATLRERVRATVNMKDTDTKEIREYDLDEIKIIKSRKSKKRDKIVIDKELKEVLD